MSWHVNVAPLLRPKQKNSTDAIKTKKKNFAALSLQMKIVSSQAGTLFCVILSKECAAGANELKGPVHKENGPWLDSLSIEEDRKSVV